MRLRTSVLAVVASLTISALVCGAGTVSRVKIEMDGWHYVPTLSQSGTRVESILAIREPGTEVGSNLTAVWFKRGQNLWRTYTWTTQDRAAIIKYVKDDIGIGDQWNYLWPVSPGATAASAPVGFMSGVVGSDSVRSSIESSSVPESAVRALELLGHPAAALHLELVDLVHGCDQTAVLEIVAEGIQLELAQSPTNAGLGIDAMTDDLASLTCLDMCWDREVVIAGPTCTGCNIGAAGWGAPPPGYGPTWIGGGQCAMVCWYQATLNCTYSRTMKQINWDCSTCTWTQTGTTSESLIRKSTEYFPNCVQPVPYACPGAPDDTTANCGDGLQSPGGWTPASPCD